MSLVDTAASSTAASSQPLEWGPVLAGASIATAIGLILLGFGAALGLGFASPYEGEGLEPAAFAIAAGLYLIWVQLMSFYCGGYVAARLRSRAPGVSEHEVDVRDGLHGLLVWSTGVIAAGVIAFTGIGGLGAFTLGDPSNPVSQAVEQEVEEGAANEAQTEPAAVGESVSERQAEIARKWSVIAAFISAASLLIGAVAAFFGAQSGGNHRDSNMVWVFFTSQARPQPSRR